MKINSWNQLELFLYINLYFSNMQSSKSAYKTI